MRLIYLILLTFILFSCSTSKKRLADGVVGEVPTWVYSPMDNCREQIEMCASGEGESFYLADLSARKSIASIFETQINSEMNSYSSSEGAVGFDDPKLKEEMSIQLTEKVDLILEGVEIKLRHEAEGVYFALALLDKAKAWRKLKKEIDEVDAKLVDFRKRKKRSTLKKMYALYDLRSKLDERYTFLRGKGASQKVSLADIKEIQYGKSSQVKNIAFGVDAQVSEETVGFLETMLTGFGHKVVAKDESFDIKIVGNIKQKKEFMKVKGFEKYSFTFYLVTKNSKGVKIGGISMKEVSVGRSQKDAYLKIEPKIQEYIEEHIDELNID